MRVTDVAQHVAIFPAFQIEIVFQVARISELALQALQLVGLLVDEVLIGIQGFLGLFFGRP